MNPQIVLWLLTIGMLGVGVFALRGAIRNSFKNVELKKAKARMLREILGEQGYRVFVGALGVLFIAASLSLAFLMLGGLKLTKGRSKTDVINIAMVSDDPNVTSGLMATEQQLKLKYEIIGETEFEKYQGISFKNNYRSDLPDLMWHMKNLESIDLTNNDFSELPLEKFSQLPKLTKLILTGNPMEPAYVEKVRAALSNVSIVNEEVPER